MAAGLMVILFWIGFTRFDTERELVGAGKREFRTMLDNEHSCRRAFYQKQGISG